MATNDIKFSKKSEDSLEHLSNLLHLFYHRNKNQHRRSIWWRHFSTFRRQLNALHGDIATLNETPKSHLERTRKKSADKERQIRLFQRLHFWQHILVPKWQNSYSQIVADGQFAVLGLVLIAVLAQTCQVTGITRAFDELGQIEVEKVLHQFGRENRGEDLESQPRRLDSGEDEGEIVVRQSMSGDDIEASRVSAISSDAADEIILKAEESAKALKPTRKRRKKESAIDDLFSSLD